MQKDEYEVAMIRKANAVSREGHEALMGMVKHARNERELEGKFLERSVAQGAKNQAYHSIVASGRAAATLHYTGNDMSLSGKENLLVDAGAEWDCYASDIVRPPFVSFNFIENLRRNKYTDINRHAPIPSPAPSVLPPLTSTALSF